MIQMLTILSGLFMSATCMVLHQAPLTLYLPIEYQEQPPNYNFAYGVNNANTGDYKRQQENRREGPVLGQYSLFQPDGVTRTVDYRADDLTGFNAVINNEGRVNNGQSDRQVENVNEDSEAGRQANGKPQENGRSKTQHESPVPIVISHASIIHQSYTNGREYRI